MDLSRCKIQWMYEVRLPVGMARLKQSGLTASGSLDLLRNLTGETFLFARDLIKRKPCQDGQNYGALFSREERKTKEPPPQRQTQQGGGGHFL